MAGNANSGRKRNQFMTDALLLEMKARELDATADNPKGARKLAQKIWDLAEGGERWAAEYVRDTIDGKPMQRTELTGPDGENLFDKVEIVFKKPDGPNT